MTAKTSSYVNVDNRWFLAKSRIFRIFSRSSKSPLA